MLKEQILKEIDDAIALQLDIKALTKDLEAAKERIKEYMKLNEDRLIANKAKAAYSHFECEVFDKALFKKRCPRIYKRFMQVMQREQLRLTELTEDD